MKYSALSMSTPVTIYNPVKHASIPLTNSHHTLAKRTLGVILSPDGNGDSQIQHSTQKAREYFGKLRNSTMSHMAQWMAVESVVEPAVMYPLMNCFFQEEDLKPIVSVISQMRCAALGLNKHFPRAILYGPTSLGGLGLSHP